MTSSFERPMITMEFKNYDGNNHRLQVDSDGSAESFMDTFRAFLYVCGFHPETIDDLLNEENQDERIDAN